MTDPTDPIISHASPAQRPRLDVGTFLFHFVATAMFVGLILLPLHGIDPAKRICEDFKLEIPASTQLTFDVYDAIVDVRAHNWLWALPFVTPFLLMRVPPEFRGRLLLLAVLLAGLLGLLSGLAVSDAALAPLHRLFTNVK